MELILIIVFVAFAAEYIDSSLGMGYGTTLAPILLLMGYEPLQVVPAVLLSEFVTGIMAALSHERMGNVDFAAPKIRKITACIAVCSIVGTAAAVFLVINLPQFYIKLYIGILVLLIGAFILVKRKSGFKFSWPKIVGLGCIASFNKGMSGGGYGPLVCGGQILSGIPGKSAIAITSMAEGLTCLVGVILFMVLNRGADWTLAPYLIVGAVCSVPLSVYTVKRIKEKPLTFIIGILAIVLGALTLWKVLF